MLRRQIDAAEAARARPPVPSPQCCTADEAQQVTLTMIERCQAEYTLRAPAAMLAIMCGVLRPEQATAVFVAAWPYAPSALALETGVRARRAAREDEARARGGTSGPRGGASGAGTQTVPETPPPPG